MLLSFPPSQPPPSPSTWLGHDRRCADLWLQSSQITANVQEQCIVNGLAKVVLELAGPLHPFLPEVAPHGSKDDVLALRSDQTRRPFTRPQPVHPDLQARAFHFEHVTTVQMATCSVQPLSRTTRLRIDIIGITRIFTIRSMSEFVLKYTFTQPHNHKTKKTRVPLACTSGTRCRGRLQK
jgi:hypothetical protein